MFRGFFFLKCSVIIIIVVIFAVVSFAADITIITPVLLITAQTFCFVDGETCRSTFVLQRGGVYYEVSS